MQRFLPALFLLILLGACARESTLPPAVVLERTVAASKSMHAARFTGTASFRNLPVLPMDMEDGTLRFDGRMQDGGNQMELSLDLEGRRMADDKRSIDLGADLVVIDSREVFVNLRGLSLGEDGSTDPAMQLSTVLAGTWWSLTPTAPSPSAPLAPDPRLVRMQAETVRIRKDNGMKKLEGTEVFHYDVSIDPEMLRTFLAARGGESGTGAGVPSALPEGDGELWIDASTYFLRKAEWSIRFPDGGLLQINVTFRDHQQPATIAPPPYALPFPANGTDLLGILGGARMPEDIDSLFITD